MLFPFSGFNVFWITFCDLVAFCHIWITFVTLCHFLSHFESHFVIFRPSSRFLWGCHKDVPLIFFDSFSPCFLVLLPTNTNLSYHIYVDGSQTCLPTPGHFYSVQTVVWGCFSDRFDWHLGIILGHHQHMTIVNIFHCCLFWSLFEGIVMKASFPVSSLVGSCKSFWIPSFKDVVFL